MVYVHVSVKDEENGQSIGGMVYRYVCYICYIDKYVNNRKKGKEDVLCVSTTVSQN